MRLGVRGSSVRFTSGMSELVHCEHALAPPAALNEPGGQGLQVSGSPLGLYMPGPQATQPRPL